jgi:hypothetical protein
MIQKNIIIENAEYFEKIKNVITSVGDVTFTATSDDGRGIIFDTSINDEIETDDILKDIISDIYYDHLEYSEGYGIIFLKEDKINLMWNLQLHIDSFSDIDEIFYKELSDVLSIPKDWDISTLMKCYFKFEGEMKKGNKVDFQKFIFSIHLYDYQDSIDDVSKKELDKFERGFAFYPDEKFQIEIKKMISRLILSSGVKDNRFIINGDTSLTTFSVYANDPVFYQLSVK